jgi:hypothetical protein
MKKQEAKYLLVTALSTLYFLILFTTHYYSNWWVLRVSDLHNGETFMDLRGVLMPLDCYRESSTSIYDSNSNDCGLYLYGRTLAVLINFSGITASQTIFWAINFVIFFCLILGLLSGFFIAERRISPILVYLVLSSPGLVFLIERANIDLIMFFLVFGACLFNIKGFNFWSILLLALATLIKFYTAPLLIALIFIGKSRKIRLFTIVVCIFVLPIIIADYLKIKAFPQGWFVSFGANFIGQYITAVTEKFSLDLPKIEAVPMYVLGLTLFGLSMLLVTKFSNSHKNDLNLFLKNKIGNEYSEKVLLFFGSVFLSVYLFGMSYDYRLMFAAVSGLALISLTPAGVPRRLIQGSLIIGLWFTFSLGAQIHSTITVSAFFVLIQFIGDLALGIFSAFLGLKLFYLYHNQFTHKTNFVGG